MPRAESRGDRGDLLQGRKDDGTVQLENPLVGLQPVRPEGAGGLVTVRAEPIYALVSPETDRLLAEAETLDAILLAAATVKDEGEDMDAVVVFKGGHFDAATTALIQEGLV